MEKIVIIGGGAAGPKITAKLLRSKGDFQIDLYTEEEMISYSACGLPYFIEGLIEDVNRLIVRTPKHFEDQGAHIHLAKRCTKIMPDEHEILIEDLKTGETKVVEYDKLAIATGARPIFPAIINSHLKNIFTVRKIQDGINIRNKIRDPETKKAVIVGGGYIGVELLEALHKNNLETTMIDSGKHILSVFDPEMSDIIEKNILSISGGKVNIVKSETVIAFNGEKEVKEVMTENGLVFEADIVILAVGVLPNTEVASQAGIELGVSNAIRVNNRMQTSVKDIYAAGDCIENFHLVSRNYCWIPLGSSANKEGRCAAINIAGQYDGFPGILGSAVTRYGDLNISLTGLSETEARKYGFDTISAIVTKKDKAGYMPDAQDITLKLVVDKRSKKILGAQAVGGGDADKRVNTVASAIMAEQTLDGFLHTDMTYAPPFSTSIDPLISAALIINNKLYK